MSAGYYAQYVLNNGQPIAQSIPATEHRCACHALRRHELHSPPCSVMTAWATERAAIENMIERFGSGVFACVMDRHVEANTLLFARSHPVTALTMSTRSPRCCPLWRPRSWAREASWCSDPTLATR